jgi:hypothetical protein
VVLAADPFANIGNTRKMELVIQRGRMIDVRALLKTGLRPREERKAG